MNEEEKSDYGLIDEALAGDERAYATIMERYRNSLGMLVYRMVGNREEAEDLVQEAFIKAFRALATFNKEYAFSTWLFKIASNNCIDHLRKKRLQTFSIDTPVETKDGEVRQEIRSPGLGPEINIIQQEAMTAIEMAIEGLPEKYRTVIELRHKKDMTYEEIAELLALPIGTVKARIFRAREILKRSLKMVSRK